jgi:hypothetical protein
MQHTFVSTLLSLANVHGRLEEIQNLLGQGRIGQGPSCEEQELASEIKQLEGQAFSKMAYLLHWR